MMATKEQERKALEQIRKIVSDLGENSYIAAAFEGCFEDAEENIEYDFAVSMKCRYNTAEKRIRELEEKLDKSERGYAKYKEELDGRYNELKDKWSKAERKLIDDDNMNTIMLTLSKRKQDLAIDMDINGEFILSHLAEPDSDDYKEAVADYQEDKAEIEKIDCAYQECCRSLRA